jgi:hypothetical protein
MQEKLNNLISLVQPFFNKTNWQSSYTTDKVAFYNAIEPYDEYVIGFTPLNEINVSVPIKSVAYKQTFFNINDVVAYVKMHLDFYEQKNCLL